MKKTIFFVLLVMVSVPIFSFVVSSDELTTKYGVSYSERQKSNYIEKNGNSFQYMGNGKWEVKQLKQSSQNSDSSGIVIFFIVLVGIIIVIGICVSNITETVAKNSGMDKESAKKLGKSAGVLAGVAAAITAAALIGKSGGIKGDPNNITITHRHKRW